MLIITIKSIMLVAVMQSVVMLSITIKSLMGALMQSVVMLSVSIKSQLSLICWLP
jgi:hypothetical protein